MKGLDNLLLTANVARKINSQFGLNNSMAQMLQEQNQWKNQFNALTIHKSLLKGIAQTQMLHIKKFLGIDTIANSIAMQPKFNIPATAFDAINSISRQHSQLFGNLRSITDLFKYAQVFSQINSLQFALSGISGQLSAIAAIHKKWHLLDDLKEITNEAIVINERIIEDRGFSKESLNEIKSFLQRIEIRVDRIDSDAKAIIWKFIALLGIILALIGEVRNWLPKPEYATKQEVETIIKEQFSITEKKLREAKEYRTTNRETKVKLNCKNRTLVIATLPKGFDIIVLQVHHEWIYVSYTSPNNGLPQTGWVMKKYLSQPK